MSSVADSVWNDAEVSPNTELTHSMVGGLGEVGKMESLGIVLSLELQNTVGCLLWRPSSYIVSLNQVSQSLFFNPLLYALRAITRN